MQRVEDLKSQELANTAWAFATTRQLDAQLFTALTGASEQRLSDFKVQELANIAWAFAKLGQLEVLTALKY